VNEPLKQLLRPLSISQQPPPTPPLTASTTTTPSSPFPLEEPTPSPLFPRDLKALTLMRDADVRKLAEDYQLDVGLNLPGGMGGDVDEGYYEKRECLNKIMGYIGVSEFFFLRGGLG
jgi:hypothetical protein